MSKWCLNCDEHVMDIFDPCPNCGMRPTDPSLRMGTGKAQYEREQGYHTHALSIKNRSKAASGLQGDLTHEVPMLYGSGSLQGFQDAYLYEIHRKGTIAKNGGGLVPGVGKSWPSWWKLVFRVVVVFLAIRFLLYLFVSAL